LETLVGRGRPLPVKLEHLSNFETQVASGRAWRERTARVFLKKNANLALLDVLCPRTDVGNQEGRRKKKTKDDLSGIQHPIFQGLTQKELLDRKVISKAFKDAEIKEIQAIKEIRNKKASKNHEESEESSDGGDSGSSSKNEVKFECEICTGSFHPSHVPLPKGKSNQPTSLHDIKFLCPSCLRSRRPRIELILSLLMNYEKISVKLPEGEALTYLIDRALAWQQRAEKILRTSEVSEELKKLNTAVIENNISKKKTKGDESSSMETETDDTESESESGSKPTKLSSVQSKKIPEIKLSNKIQTQLEEIMLEGDLLEVTMDENHQIWKLLQATEPRRSRKYPDLNQLEAELETAREEKLRARKKRKLEAVNAENQAKKIKLDEKATPDGKKRKGGGRRVKKDPKSEESEDAEEEQEDCSAKPKCLKPVGKEVHWVQCDGCELWLHLNCIGLRPSDVTEDEDFICRDCKPLKKPKASAAPKYN